MVELLPCPFCGSEPVPQMKDFDGDVYYWFYCSEPECPLHYADEAHFSGLDPDDAILKWNHRDEELVLFGGAKRLVNYDPRIR